MKKYFLIITLFLKLIVFSQTVHSGFSWLSSTSTSVATSPNYISGDCSNINYTINCLESFRRTNNGPPYSNNCLYMPAVSSNTSTLITMTITFNQSVSNLKIRFIDLDENNSGMPEPEESLTSINPAPSSVTSLGVANPFYLVGNVVTPTDNSASNHNNNTAGWINWNGTLTSVSFCYNRPSSVNAGLIIDSIYFDCPSNCSATAFASPDVIICPNQTTTLDASNSTGNQFTWSNGSNASSISVSTPGIYWVTVTDGTCSDSDTVIVSTQTFQPNVLNNTATICSNASLTLNAFSANVTSYLWSTGQTTSSINVSNPGTYWVQVSNGTCSFNDTVIVNSQIYEPNALNSFLTICPNSSFTLDASVTNSTSYLWNTGQTTSSINANNTGTFWVQVSNGICSFSDTIIVTNQVVSFTPIPNLNYLCSNETLSINAIDDSVVTYLWSTNETTSSITINQPGIYWVERTNLNGCTIKDSITITEISLHNTETSFDKCEGESVLLFSSQNNATNYLWNTGATNENIVVFENGTYTVSTTNSCGVSIDKFTIVFYDCDCGFYIPNSFTPDEDEFNQVFKIKSDCQFFDFHLEIFNRWGEIVFESYDIDEYWDGNYGSKEAQDNIYTYKVSYVSLKNPKRINLSGHISLLK